MKSTLSHRAVLALSTIPTATQLWNVVGITATTTATAGVVAAGTGFIKPVEDFYPPWSSVPTSSSQTPSLPSHSCLPWMKPLSAFIFPSLVEELFWRGMLIPHPSMITNGGGIYSILPQAGIVLLVHILSHPLAGNTVWSRGKDLFSDPRFLLLATIVLGGATVSYLLSGGSVWCAALTHGVPVALWRDFFGGEAKLLGLYNCNNNSTKSFYDDRKDK
jgi:predicted Abi (CAAX) family protease